MEDWQARQRMLTGDGAVEALARARVAVVGLGGVGSAAVEALARAGVGHLYLVDNDTVSVTNRNRQLIATVDTFGLPKTRVCRQRVLSVNPQARVETAEGFVLPGEDAGVFAFGPDYIVDAVDTMAAKLFLMEEAARHGVALISCMGTGNRLSAEGFVIDELSRTTGSGCPVARVLRREARKRGLSGVTVLYNKNPPDTAVALSEGGRHAPGSISYVPPVAGFLAAGHVVRAIMHQAQGGKKADVPLLIPPEPSSRDGSPQEAQD